MAGEHDKLRETLNRLQVQIDELRRRDPEVAQHLQTTLAEANAVLGGEPTRPDEHRSLVERLSNAVLKYETSHPILAGGLGKIIDALSQMGV